MTLHLNSYLDTQIMKMGRWRSNTFMEYICGHIDKFSEGMSISMAKRFQFVKFVGRNTSRCDNFDCFPP